MDRHLISIAQACTVAGVSRRSLYNWINAAKVEYVRTAGGAIRVYADSLFRTPDMAVLASPASDTHVVVAAGMGRECGR